VLLCLVLLCLPLLCDRLAFSQPTRPTQAVPPPATGQAARSSQTPAPVPSPSVVSELAATLPESAKLPLDPAVRTGVLANGLTYYVRHNARPEKRAEIWLAVNAGSTLEDDDQQGLAHLVEHMAFRGTKNFKKLEIINFMERIGMKFGPDINAHTGFDETVYMLTVPTDDAAVVERALAILYDWSCNVSFDDHDIDTERGVVLEEWRLGRGAEARMLDKQFPTLFKGSRYAERLTIGKKEVIETAPHETIRRFYRDWYRPDLMAVIVVGEVDPEAIEPSIRTRFASLVNPPKPRPRTLFPVPDHAETLVSTATDPEATSTRVGVYYKLPKKNFVTVADFRRTLVESLYHGMVNSRLAELRQRPDPPFLYAFSGSGSFVRTRDVVYQTAGVQEAGLARGIETLLVELARVDAHGFGASEFGRIKKQLLRSFETAYQERDKTESDSYSDEISSAFLEREPMPGIAVEFGLAQRFLPAISLDEVDHLAREWIGDSNRVILVNGPEKAATLLPSEEQLREIFKEADTSKPEPWVDRVRQEPLVPTPPQPAIITEETAIAPLGVTRWKLSNDVVVLLKPTDFKNDEVLLGGFNPGGSSLVSDDRYVSTSYASQVLSEGGWGQFDKIELGKALADKIARASAYIGGLEESVSGSASPQDLETMFQLLYLNFTSPRADEKAFTAWKARTKATIENRLARPETVFADAMLVTMAQGHFRRRPMTVAILDEVDLKTAEAVWRERFGDASGFTFGLVGAFTLDQIRPLVLRYLGGLPSHGRRETWKDVGIRPPGGAVKVEVKKGIEPKSQVRMTFTGPATWSPEADHLIGALGEALRIRLRDVLREDMGGVYGVGSYGSISRAPVEQYVFSIAFGCDPERVAELKKAVEGVLDAAKKDGFAPDVVGKVREQQLRERETDLKENGIIGLTNPRTSLLLEA
jgi:zinc protease